MFGKPVLDTMFNIDILAGMLRAAYTMEEWQDMINVADRLYLITREFYDRRQFLEAKGQSPDDETKLERSIAYYFGFSMLAKGIALQKQGRYSDARDCVEKYAELGWIYGLNQEGQQEVEYYHNIAKANTYALDLLEGKIDVLPEYVKFVRDNGEDELLPGIITILEAAIINDYDVDWALEEFESELKALDGEYDTEVSIRYYVDHLYFMAVYFLKMGNFSNALNIAIKGLRMSDKLKDEGFKKLNALFVSFRGHATKEQMEEYNALNKTILGRALKDEKGILFNGSSFTSANRN